MTDSAPEVCFVSAEIVERELRNAVLSRRRLQAYALARLGEKEVGVQVDPEKDLAVSRIGSGAVRPMLARLLCS